MERKRTDITSADTKILGFEYQYLFFLLKCLRMTKGGEVGYEILDDVHVIDSLDQIYLFQLKYTTEKNAEDGTGKLTILSLDMWKTLSNWAKMISDKNDGRKYIKQQKEFIQNHSFVYVTNRVTENDFIDHVNDFKKKVIKEEILRQYIERILSQTTNPILINYIKDVLQLKESVLSLYFNKLSFVTTEGTIIDDIKEAIREKMVPDAYIDGILNEILGQLKVDFFSIASQRKHQVITYSQWRQKYQGIFTKYRNTALPLREFHPQLPQHLNEQHFVKELVEIGAIETNDSSLAEISRWTSEYLEILFYLKDWENSGVITQSNVSRFHQDAIIQWENTHRKVHRATNKTDKESNRVNAVRCFDEVLEKKLTLISTDIGTELSNGEYIFLAEDDEIGWKYEWREKYGASRDA